MVGGPLIRNKTFFFVTYEHTEQKNPLSSTRTVPTLLQRQGDFSETRNAAGQVMTIYNPFDTFVNAAGNIERRPFPGNRIPTSMMDPIALKALAYFPLPNTASTSITDTNNWFGQGINQSVSRQMNLKIDHNFTTQSRLTARYSHAPSTGTPPNIFGELGAAFPLNNGPSVTNTHSFVTEFTRTQSSTSLWNVRYGLTYSGYTRDPIENYNLTGLGLPQYMRDQADYEVFPRFAPDGYSPIGTEGWLKMDRQEGVHHFSGSYTKMMGGHNIKAGSEFRFNFLDYAQPGYPSGGFNVRQGCHLQGSVLLSGQRGQRRWPRCSSAGPPAAIFISTRRSSRGRPIGGSLSTTTGGSRKSSRESRSALRLRRAALGNAESHELLGPRSAVADTSAWLRHSRRHQVR